MTPHWLPIVHREWQSGVREIPGSDHNARIIQYHAATSLKATTDEIAWCSSLACWVMKHAGIAHPGSAAARSWLFWGREIDFPVMGCVTILRRGTNHGPEVRFADGTYPPGHVGFFVGFAPDAGDAGGIQLLGGNQSNRISVRSYPIASVLGYRMPQEPEEAQEERT